MMKINIKNKLFYWIVLAAGAMILSISCSSEHSPVSLFSGSAPPILLGSGSGVSVITLAGSSTSGAVNGPGATATFFNPGGVAVNTAGTIYVADTNNNLIRSVTPAGLVTTFAGSGIQGAINGPVTSASFNKPTGVAVDSAGNVYVADSGNNLIREITTSGVVITLAGTGTSGSLNGPASIATFFDPTGVAVDSSGNVYVADAGNDLIREITSAGTVLTLAGSGIQGSTNGTGTSASFFDPTGVAVDSSGNVYVADSGNNMIRKIASGGIVTTLAGSGAPGSTNGLGSNASFNVPMGVAIDSSGNVYVADASNNMIRKVTASGNVTTLAGTGLQGSTNGSGSNATFFDPHGVAVNSSGDIYVADTSNNLIREIIP
jgi:sugar lactone lactonase YvrE